MKDNEPMILLRHDAPKRHQAEPFFAYARERYMIHLRREAGEPWPWTKDPVLQQYRFCNVFREDDRVTRWMKEHVRDVWGDRPEGVLAVAAFRMFNRIETGGAVFVEHSGEVFCEFARTGNWRVLKSAILRHCGEGPYVTGSYIVAGPAGYSKLEGICRVLGKFARGEFPGFAKDDSWGWREVGTALLGHSGYSLEHVWNWLREVPYFGPFHAYEMGTDLRRTPLLSGAPDVCTWANPGPGARRGLNRVMERSLDEKPSRELMLKEMSALLRLSHCYPRLWPAEWPRWEMREVEHTLCEFDKIERTRSGEGRPRQIYRREA
jgi:hypothetical protein